MDDATEYRCYPCVYEAYGLERMTTRTDQPGILAPNNNPSGFKLRHFVINEFLSTEKWVKFEVIYGLIFITLEIRNCICKSFRKDFSEGIFQKI